MLRFFMNVYLKSMTTDNRIAITFDDGPSEHITLQLLELLDTWGVKATFFMTGINALKNKDLVLEVSKNGHEIGNHSFDHPRKLFSLTEELFYQVRTTNDILQNITNKPVTLYRPPFGLVSPFLFNVCQKLSLKIILWSVNTHDYRREKGNVIAERAIKKTKSGSIILFHECNYKNPSLDYSNTVNALKILMSDERFKKYKSVTISSLINFRNGKNGNN